MKRMKIMKAMLAMALCIVTISGCTSAEKIDPAAVCGTWTEVDGDMTTTYVINADGTYTDDVATSGEYAVSMSDSGTYSIDGNTITFVSNSFGTDFSYDVSFSGEDMIWDNGKVEITLVKGN